MGRPHHDLAQLGLVDENGPTSSIRSMSPFHSGQPSTSAHRRQIASGAALVSTLCSVAHIVTSLVFAEMICT